MRNVEIYHNHRFAKISTERQDELSKGLPAQGGAEPAAVLYRAYKEPPPPGRQVNRPASLARAGGPHRVGLYRSSPGLSSIRFCRLPRSHALRPPPLADAFEARWNSGQLLHLTSSSESCGSGECRMLSAFCIVSRLRVSVLAWGHICVWVGTFSFACVGSPSLFEQFRPLVVH